MNDTTASLGKVTDEIAREWPSRFLAAWNTHDADRLAALATEDVDWEDPFIYPNGRLRGREELRQWLRSVWRAWPDLTFEVVGEPLVSLDRKRIGFLWLGTGTMTGPLDPPGVAPTGKRLEAHGSDIHLLRNGLVAHVITHTDPGAALR